MRMEIQAKNARLDTMQLRKVLQFNGTMGLTLPRAFADALDLHWQDHVEIYFVNPDKIILKKHVLGIIKAGNIDGK